MYLDAIAQAAEATPQAVVNVAMVPGLVLHVDGDYLAYYASGNDDTTPGEARLNAFAIIEGYRAAVGAEKVVVHNTGRGCHKGERFLIATVKPYQGQRDSGRKPKNHAYLQQVLMEYEGSAFLSKTWATREADDGIGACAHFAIGKPPGYVGIATRDKDLRMLPGYHVNWMTRQVTVVPPGAYDVVGADGKQYGLKFFWLQMLQGDTADNCPGLQQVRISNPDGTFKTFKKIGEKGAEAMLAGTKTSDEAGRIVLKAYLEGYSGIRELAMDRFCEQAALMWMRCDRTGSFTDFAYHAGHSKISTIFDEEVWAAVKRLEDRVKSARTKINSFGS